MSNDRRKKKRREKEGCERKGTVKSPGPSPLSQPAKKSVAAECPWILIQIEAYIPDSNSNTDDRPIDRRVCIWWIRISIARCNGVVVSRIGECEDRRRERERRARNEHLYSQVTDPFPQRPAQDISPHRPSTLTFSSHFASTPASSPIVAIAATVHTIYE